MAIIGASIISAAAFTIGDAIYDQFRNLDTERHNKAMEKLNDEATRYNKERQLTLDYINYQMHLQQNAITDFNDIDAALERYNDLFPENKIELRDKPKLTYYYTPSDEKINAEYTILIISGLIGDYIVYNYL